MDFLGEVAGRFASALWGGGFFGGSQFGVVSLVAFGVAQDFVGGIEFLGAGQGFAGAAVHIGVMLLGEDAVGGADLGIGAAAVEAERGVMVWCGCLQRREFSLAGNGKNRFLATDGHR